MKKYKKAYIEITNNCNLNCSFCPKTTRDKKFMSPDSFEHVINEIEPYVNFLYLHLMGEPLMHPELDKILDISEKHNMKINITSNGTLISRKIDLLLEKSAVRKVSFSLHSFEANELSNVNDDNRLDVLNKYLDDLIDACQRLESKDKIAVLKLWNLDSSNKDIYDGYGKNDLNEYIFRYVLSKLISPKSYDIESARDILVTKKNLEISKHIYMQLGEKFDWPVNTDENSNFDKTFCYGLIDQFGVLVGGEVVPCCLDSEGMLSFGNIFKESFKSIIEKNSVLDFANKIREGKCASKLCSKCTYARKKVK